MPVSDTHPKIQEMHDRMIKAMTREQRIESAFEMSLLARELAKARIQKKHPEWTEKQVMLELFRLAFLPAQLPKWVK